MSCSEEWKKFNHFKTWNDPDWMNHNRATRQQIFKRLKKDNPDMLFNPTVISFGTFPLPAPCPAQQGNNPMRYNEISATANVTAPKSDEAIQREYLLDRLQSAHYPKIHSMVEHFNLHVNNTPKTYKELIDTIKKGKYTLDEKITKKIDAQEDDDSDDCDVYYDGPFYGIVWDGPQPDRKGYMTALEEINKMYQAAKDTIMVSDAAEGLKAIQKFEAWMPK